MLRINQWRSRFAGAFKRVRPFMDDVFGLVRDNRRLTPGESLRQQLLPTVLLMLAVLSLYGLSVAVPAGPLSYAASVPALTIVWLTAVARVNDITAPGRRWHVRRFALVLVGTGAVALLARPFFIVSAPYPTWIELYFVWGFALTWMTTPNMPPWFRYISGSIARDRRAEPREPQT